MKSYKILFFCTLILGTLITISAYSWLSMWMGLEINLLSIIPLLKDKNNVYPSEAALKYFITQALASSIFLFSIILTLNLSEFFNFSEFSILITNSALLMKIGAAPFHSWFPEVMEGLNWMNATIMLTWQKIAPMVLIFYNSNLTFFLLAVILFSSIISGIIGLNQISLRKILAYSSINHISWLLASMINSQTIWTIYFLVYVIITVNITLILKYFNIFYLLQLQNLMGQSKLFKFFFMMNFLSLGGLPPFLGFFPKWLVINNLVINQFYLMSVILIIFTLISLYFYLRISFSTLMISTNEIMLNFENPSNFWVYFFNFVSLSGLLACTLIFNFI
uniref:NADH-ubiquinone oxidoreductase chain 2 n=1 Tax=Coleoptera sp. ACP-2013 TaxID=2485033 RepID=A0A3G3MEI3_9COLE|nr:NADH dehydrogenase subunit 2 [Coleoptera sp. ACP-2013]